MDTSEQYIKMCDCREIQDGWMSRAGDYVFGPEMMEGYGYGCEKTPESTFWIFNFSTLEDEDGIDPRISEKPLVAVENYAGDWCSGPIPIELITWLPHQHQIQEMVSNYLEGQINLLLDYLPTMKLVGGGKRRKIDEAAYDSWEQLWLCIYMHEKHNKTWDGDKWKEIDK